MVMQQILWGLILVESYRQWTVKGKVAPFLAMKAYKERSSGTAPLILWMVIFTPRLLYAREWTPISIKLEAGMAAESIWTVL
jgi:hypothetical protein